MALAGPLRIDHGMVSEDGAFFLEGGDHRGDIGLGPAETFRDLRRREPGVALEKFEKGIHDSGCR
jgi:hypothetical protein